MKAYVICCNDSVEFVVLNSEEKANIKKDALKEEHFERNKHTFKNREQYENRCFWHLHDVSYT